MHFEITASQQTIRKPLSSAQRNSSLFSEAPRVGGKTLRRGQVLKFTKEQFEQHKVMLKRLFSAGAIEIVHVDGESRHDFRDEEKKVFTSRMPLKVEEEEADFDKEDAALQALTEKLAQKPANPPPVIELPPVPVADPAVPEATPVLPPEVAVKVDAVLTEAIAQSDAENKAAVINESTIVSTPEPVVALVETAPEAVVAPPAPSAPAPSSSSSDHQGKGKKGRK